MGKLPKGTPLAPAQLASFSKRSLTKPKVPALSTRALPYLTAVGACARLLLGLFSVSHFLAERVESKRIFGLNLPQFPSTPVVEAAPPIAVTPPTEPDTAAVTPGKETIVISEAGLSRGPRLLRQIGPGYPALAKMQ